MTMAREWHGMTLRDKADRAAGRGLIGIGMEGARATKLVTHRISGTLARSVHIAPFGYEDSARDEAEAPEMDLMMTHAGTVPTLLPGGPTIELGSWLPYACVEWVGRGHPGVTQGLEVARSRANAYVTQAFREEGL